MMIIACCWCFGALLSVLPRTMATLQRGSSAPELHHFRPVITYESPSRLISVWMFKASLLATAGSVIRKHDRMSPFSSGTSHLAFCSGVPNFTSTSMFPVSGAEQLHASDAILHLPIISARCAYSALDKPAPSWCSLGRKRFHRPLALALALSFSITGGIVQRIAGLAMCASYSSWAGSTSSLMKAMRRCLSSTMRGVQPGSEPAPAASMPSPAHTS
mmetsp:Transcript_12283/g.30072  ORF Transcript_12283/g.30072 Transcript_12283/m.30072 type:complete len:217 (-) Transcript_12283:14-664(-)